MKVKLFLNKSVNQNAENYFSKAKKLKNKLPGIEETLKKTEKERLELEKNKEHYLSEKKKKEVLQEQRPKEWYEKFRYTFSSEGKLFVMGRDAGTNEVLIKKHLEEEDIVFHTMAAGSPFGILKGGKNASEKEIMEVGTALLCFSKQWTSGFGSGDAFWVNPDQVTKQAQSGEYIGRGSFMIYGKKNILKNLPLRIALGVKKEKIVTEEGEELVYEHLFSGHEDVVKKECGTRMIRFEPGQNKHKAMLKDMRKRLKYSYFEDLPKYIPNECRMLKN